MANALMIAFGKPGKKGKEGSLKEELSESDDEATEESDLDPDFVEAANDAYNADSKAEYAKALYAAIKACHLADKESSEGTET